MKRLDFGNDNIVIVDAREILWEGEAQVNRFDTIQVKVGENQTERMHFFIGNMFTYHNDSISKPNQRFSYVPFEKFIEEVSNLPGIHAATIEFVKNFVTLMKTNTFGQCIQLTLAQKTMDAATDSYESYNRQTVALEAIANSLNTGGDK